MSTTRIKVKCLECGKTFWTASSLPYCPRCNSADIEPVFELSPLRRIACREAAKELEHRFRVTSAAKHGFWTRLSEPAEDFGGAFDGIRVTSDADGGL